MQLDRSFLVRIFGFPATLIHGDPLVLDRWLWIRRRLPRTRNGERLLDVGCGSGAFSIGAALRGYDVLGLSWDERNQAMARERARLSSAPGARFEVCDVRKLDQRKDMLEGFDVALCCENIEHILDDRKLMIDIAACLKPGGRLLLTTPYFLQRPISVGDQGPFSKTEDGWHVRRGYSRTMLAELCTEAGLVAEEFSSCSGLLSQKTDALHRAIARLHPLAGWAGILPLRPLPPLLDRGLQKLTSWPDASICLEAYKPRFASAAVAPARAAANRARKTEASS
jgi:2-polyprenyl-3-methyl-5-hydroxy-6-metoxy-1,4-benzoquinol methylase